MSAIVKEKIFDELRRYHVQTWPKKLATERMQEAKDQLGLIEDKIIGMLMGLVNGRSVFADSTEELEAFRQKLNRPSGYEAEEKNNQAIFTSKIDWLQQILLMAKEPNFQLRKQKVSR
jgi:hypothetical protein